MSHYRKVASFENGIKRLGSAVASLRSLLFLDLPAFSRCLSRCFDNISSSRTGRSFARKLPAAWNRHRADGQALNNVDASQSTRSQPHHARQTYNLVKKHTQPPKDKGGWMAISRDLLESPAWRSLSTNCRKLVDRIVIEHIGHNRLKNGELIVTHPQFRDYGLTGDLVADAIDEAEFKGLIRAERGRAGNGTAHPTLYRLTFDGDWQGAAASNEWARVTDDDVRRWSASLRDERREKRSKLGKKRKTSLRNPGMRPLRNQGVRRPDGQVSLDNCVIQSTSQPIPGIRSAMDSMPPSTTAKAVGSPPVRMEGRDGR